MRVNIITESVLFPKLLGGVHVAYLNQLRMLKTTDVEVVTNSLGKADVTHIHTIWPFAIYKLLTSHPVVLPSHHLPESFIGSYRGGKVLQTFIKKYLRFFYNHADLVLAMTQAVKERLIEIGVTTRIEVLPNPIDTHEFKKDDELKKKGRAEYGIPDDAIVVMSAGYVIPRKGIAEFVLLARKFPEITFLWAGDQPTKLLAAETKQQKNLLEHLPANVIITGFVAYDKMPTLYNMGDIFLFASHQETQGFVIIEAAACGLPLVLRDLSLYKELYTDSYIAEKDVDGFASAIRKLQHHNDFYEEHAEKALKMAQRFSYPEVAKRMLAFYHSLPHKE